MKAKSIKIEFDEKDDWWQMSSSEGIELEEAVRMVREAWADHEKSKEPLIKDEKVRKAVRAWAEANDVVDVNYYKSSHYWYLRAFDDYERGIDFWLWYNHGKEQELTENKGYTIAELCGEEE